MKSLIRKYVNWYVTKFQKNSRFSQGSTEQSTVLCMRALKPRNKIAKLINKLAFLKVTNIKFDDAQCLPAYIGTTTA